MRVVANNGEMLRIAIKSHQQNVAYINRCRVNPRHVRVALHHQRDAVGYAFVPINVKIRTNNAKVASNANNKAYAIAPNALEARLMLPWCTKPRPRLCGHLSAFNHVCGSSLGAALLYPLAVITSLPGRYGSPRKLIALENFPTQSRKNCF
jgi:hypothetical protein